MKISPRLRGSSTVERLAVNQWVRGSNPLPGALGKIYSWARSSAAEQLAHNQLVDGSSPSGPIFTLKLVMRSYKLRFNFLSSKLITVISFIIIIYAAFGLARLIWKNYQVNQKIESLKKEITQLEEENFELRNEINYYKTNSYKERLAREKLNLQKPGEIVIVITQPEEDKFSSVQNKGIKNKEKKLSVPNWRKWWNYFFGDK